MKKESDPFVEVLEHLIRECTALRQLSPRHDVAREAAGLASEFEKRICKHQKITERGAKREEKVAA